MRAKGGGKKREMKERSERGEETEGKKEKGERKGEGQSKESDVRFEWAPPLPYSKGFQVCYCAGKPKVPVSHDTEHRK